MKSQTGAPRIDECAVLCHSARVGIEMQYYHIEDERM
jgi:hypothetical protein